MNQSKYPPPGPIESIERSYLQGLHDAAYKVRCAAQDLKNHRALQQELARKVILAEKEEADLQAALHAAEEELLKEARD